MVAELFYPEMTLFWPKASLKIEKDSLLSQDMIFWLNKTFLKDYDLLLLFLEKKVFQFGRSP